MAKRPSNQDVSSNTTRAPRAKRSDPSGPHLAALKELRAGSVVSQPIRKWLVTILDNWAARGAPWLPDPNAPKKRRIGKAVARDIRRIARILPRIEAAEYMRAWIEAYGDGSFESACAAALDWAGKRYPLDKFSRTTLIEEYNELKRMDQPPRSIDYFHGRESEEQARQYDEVLDDYRASFEEPKDDDELAAENAEREMFMIENFATRLGKNFAKQISEQFALHASEKIAHAANERTSLNFSDELIEVWGDAFIQGVLEGLQVRLRADVPKAFDDVVNKIPVRKIDS